MGKDYNILDSMAGENARKTELKLKAFEASNDLTRIGHVRDINDIQDVVKATDYAFMKDPLKYSNLDMKVNAKEQSEDLVVCKVIVGGREIDFMINLSETNGLNKGDILRIDLDKEGKENQTEFSEDFLAHIEEKSGSLLKFADVEEILAGLGIKNYEDIVSEVNRKDGFKVDQKKAVEGINKNRGLGGENIKKEEVDNNTKDGNVTEEEQKEVDIKEAAQKAGIPQDAIEAFCEKYGIEKITGINFTSNAEELSQKLNKDLPQDGGNLIMIKAAGVDGKANSAYVLDQNGEVQYEPGDTPNGESFLLDVVKEGSSGEEIQDLNEAAEEKGKVKIANSKDGLSDEYSEVEGPNMSDSLMIELEREISELMEKMQENLERIESDTNMTPLEKAKMSEAVCINTYTEGERLQADYGVVLPDLTEKTLNKANAAVENTEKEEVKTAVGTVAKGAIGAFAAATGMKMMDDDEPEAFVVPGKRTRD